MDYKLANKLQNLEIELNSYLDISFLLELFLPLNQLNSKFITVILYKNVSCAMVYANLLDIIILYL